MPSTTELATLYVGVAEQTLIGLDASGQILQEWPVSTATNGVGNRINSGQTPLGWHRIRAWIGSGATVGTVFRGRRPSGEIYSPALAAAYPHRDWILTRILWLCGIEPGFNRGGGVDTMRRYIYIHGTPDSEPMGEPCSHGCIRMRNQAIIELFSLTTRRTRVCIVPSLNDVVKD